MYRDNQICFCWNLNYKCNYRCPYCFFSNRWDEVLKDDLNFPADQWITSWRRIYDAYGKVRIETAGGEPFLFPAFTSCINEICKLHDFTITTNLSCSLETLRSVVDRNGPERLSWNVSFHPSFVELNEFLRKVSFLKDNKFQILVMYVAYPPQLKKAAYFKRAFQKMGVTFFIQAFQGEYQGVNYPGGYTYEQKRRIYNLEDKQAHRGTLARLSENQLLKKSTKDKLCLAGYKYAFADSNGIVYRCTRERKYPMGYFFDLDFKLFEGAAPCEFEDCPCEFTWLVEEQT